MPSQSPNITRIPSANVGLLELDKKTGDPLTNWTMSREWYRFLQNLFVLSGGGSNPTTIADLQIGPDVNEAANFFAVTERQIDDLAQSPALQPPNPYTRYGSFYDTTTQTAAIINTAVAVAFANTTFAWGVTQSDTSRINIDRPGVYSLDFTSRLNKVAAGAATAFVWVAVNGTAVANSTLQVILPGGSLPASIMRNFLLQCNAGDYVEVMFSVTDLAVQLIGAAVAGPVPAVPSVQLNVFRVGDI